jgi:hypothetical protein
MNANKKVSKEFYEIGLPNDLMCHKIIPFLFLVCC